MEWYLKVMRNYANFDGRARRKEYWMFTLFQMIFLVLAVIIDNIMGTTVTGLHYGLVYLVLLLATFIPSLAVSVRRLHDIGKSGWLYLLILIPIIGGIYLLVLLATNGNSGENEYGADPKETMPETEEIEESLV